jgi:hypothetical protein
MSDEFQGDDEYSRVAEHLESLQKILQTTTDVAHRTALERLIIYLGNRLADIAESHDR